MAKFLRKKSDGWVYRYNEVLARRSDMQEFEFDGQPPTQIDDLTDFLTGKDKPVKRTRKTADLTQAPAEE